jgi:hypothetical protein
MQSPLLGFNNNVRHKGKIFHLQTEDSGIKHPHVITHLFADGGRIVKTMKTSYAEHVGNDRLSDIVRDLMKEQHKAMFISLRDGQFDGMITGTSAAPLEPRRVSLALPPLSPAAPPPKKEALPQSPPPPDVEPLPAEPRPPPRQQAPELFTAPLALGETSVDIEALQRSALASEIPAPSILPAPDLPPPPPNVLGGKKPDGGYRALPSERPKPGEKPSAPGSGRYAASRPATIFASARPADSGSIFGEDLISEKSLDEVILSYLAEDLEGATPKK